MKINKTELLKALEIVKPGLANREMIEQATSFAFMGDKVVTYNDEISISHPIEGMEITGAVQANELYQLLNKIKKEEINFDITKTEIKIKAGKSKAGITLKQEIVLPLEEIGKQGKWKKLPEGFIEAIKFAIFSTSKDMSKPILTCIHIRKDGIIESSNNYRITQYNLENEMPVKDFLLPASSAQKIIGHNLTHIAQGTGWVHFKTAEDTVFSCRIFEENYPDVSKVFAVKGKKIKFPKKIADILDRATVFSKRDYLLDEVVQVHLTENNIRIRSEAESGWFEEEAKIKYKDEDVSFTINPDFLKDICDKATECILGDCIKFKGENWEHVLALFKDEE